MSKESLEQFLEKLTRIEELQSQIGDQGECEVRSKLSCSISTPIRRQSEGWSISNRRKRKARTIRCPC